MFDEVQVQPEVLQRLAEKALVEIDATMQLPSHLSSITPNDDIGKNAKGGKTGKPEILIYYPGKKQLEEQQKNGKPVASPFSKVPNAKAADKAGSAESGDEADDAAGMLDDSSPAAIEKALAEYDLRKTPLSRYDEHKRDPKYAGAETTSCWELVRVQNFRKFRV
jgi:hypothetical protein